MKIVLTVVLVWFGAIAAYAIDDERIFIDAKINDQPVRFAFDSGAGVPFLLYSETAKKLNLKVTPPSADAKVGAGQVPAGWTDIQTLEILGSTVKTRLAVVEIPPYITSNEDGAVGWPALASNDFSLDCVNHTASPVAAGRKEFRGWVRCRIQTNTDLTLELPDKGHSREIIALDSGSTHGVELNPQQWLAWKSSHTNQVTTYDAYYTPGSGLVVAEEGWADKISLGKLTLTDVPVMQASSSDVALHSASQFPYEATLGLAAMKRLDIVIDGKDGVVYLRPKNTPPTPYEYNHLGAVFVPKDLQSDDLIAHVAKGSPAYEAGIRDGDILLKEDGRDVTNWRNPNVKINTPFREQSAGTKFKLTLKRGDTIFNATATLQNILATDSATNSN